MSCLYLFLITLMILFFVPGKAKAHEIKNGSPWVELEMDGETVVLSNVEAFAKLSASSDEEGNVIAFYNGLPITGIRKFYNPDGQLYSVENLLNGQLHGPVQLFWDNGVPIRESVYDNSKRIAEKHFYRGGELRSESPAPDEHGFTIYKQYHKNGALKTEIPHQHGVKKGLAKEYDENGRLIKETLYENIQKA